MKKKDDASEVSLPSDQSASNQCSIGNATSLSSFIQQENLCKELYISMGVPPTDIADTSDDDVASILEQMSRLQPCAQESGGGGDRNIEDILREAESLLDGQQVNANKLNLRKQFDVSNALPHPSSTDINLGDGSQCSNAVQNSQKKQLNVTQTLQSSGPESESDLDHSDCTTSSDVHHQSSRNPKQHEAFVPSHLVGTPLEVTYKRIYDQIRKEVDGTLKPHLTGDFPDLRLSLPIPGLDTPSFDIPGCFNLEQEFLEERKRCLKLKADLDWLRRQHEREVSDLRRHHEGQLNQVREELRPCVDQGSSVLALQNEIKAQQQIISGYQRKNEEMVAELKDIKRVLLKLMTLLKTDNDSVCVFP